jgi:putative methionine-R-sulfoxide reductase with GAF domain
LFAHPAVGVVLSALVFALFHGTQNVPLFVDQYGAFGSTQAEILPVFRLLREQRFTPHLEIETYTWDVLPPALKQDLLESIHREYRWVLDVFPGAFLREIERSLQGDGAAKPDLPRALDQILRAFGCVVGTIHRFDAPSGILQLAAQKGIPPTILEQVQAVPVGKGMAGLAAQRREPVQVCNLQTDTSGAAKPGAKETRMEGSIAVPMLVGDTLRGVLGVAKPIVYEFSEAEIRQLLQVGSLIGGHLEG